jgi:hypothetical protein
MTFPKTPRLLVPLSFCITTFLASGCNIPWDELTPPADEDEGEDESDSEGVDTEGEDTEGGKPSISSAGPSGEAGEETGGEDSTTEPWGNSGGADTEGGGYEGGYETDGGYETAGGFPGNAACASYCAAELTCYADYASVEECQAVCDEQAVAAGACATAFDDLNWCLGSLDCEQAAAFWAGFNELVETGSAAPFPCDQALLDFANCDAGGSGGAG